MTQITFDGLSKTYSSSDQVVEAVRDLSLTIESGEFVVIVGPSGSGKSTTLRLLAGLEDPTEGSIKFDGESVEQLPPAQRDIAMVFQNYALYPGMSVQENLGYGLKHSSTLTQHEREQRVVEVAEQLDITELLETAPRDLSGGQRQRVALGRAIARKPQVFLLDEPLSNLDATLRTRMRHEIQSIHSSLGISTVYVTHDQKEAMTMADRIVIMREGQPEMIGTPDAVYNTPSNRFVGEFIGSPTMNVFPVTLTQQTASTHIDWNEQTVCTLESTVSTDPSAVLGIRPEHIELSHNSTGPGLEGRVQVTEYQGSTHLVYIDIGEHRIIARTSPTASYEAEASVSITVSPDNVYLFHPETGDLLKGRTDSSDKIT